MCFVVVFSHACTLIIFNHLTHPITGKSYRTEHAAPQIGQRRDNLWTQQSNEQCCFYNHSKNTQLSSKLSSTQLRWPSLMSINLEQGKWRPVWQHKHASVTTYCQSNIFIFFVISNIVMNHAEKRNRKMFSKTTSCWFVPRSVFI